MTARRADLRPGGTAAAGWRAVVLGLTAATGLLVLALTLVRDLLTDLPGAGEPVPVHEGLCLLAQSVAALAAGALAVVLLLGGLAAAPGRSGRSLRSRAPWWVARTAAALLVVGGGGQVAAAAVPATGPAPVPAAVAVAAASQPSWDRPEVEEPPVPGWRPTTPRTRTLPSTELVSRGTAPDVVVVVRRGDTLWDIAARHLGPTATVEETAAAWPRWYEANRTVIGPDPDLILPGQRLVPPTGPELSGARS